MKIARSFSIPEKPSTPMDYAVQKRSEPVLQTVKRAIENKHVMLAYQPVMHTHDPTRPAFFEGLVRVLDETQEIVEAKSFIPIVEAMELGRVLDCHALELGLEALANEPTLRLAINMSARSIGYPLWMEILNKGFAQDSTIAERLILEITEGSAVLMPDIVNTFMRDLHYRGVSFALDDFGEGYTAFRFFRDFQFDIVKIDGQFIRNIHTDVDNQVLTSALMMIASQFNMFAVAEHVETAEELAYLQSVGIDCVQGYHLGRPEIVPAWTQQKYGEMAIG